ncbi:MAG TPA: response regulator, partial [bacterium]|nr:response regulator [bacterium]
IVQQNHGFINVYSELGHGTTFRIYFPQHQQQAQESPREESLRQISHGNETVLLVEDESAILRLAQTMLERWGYRVLTASKPSEAIQIAQSYPESIHLLITDVIMPEMNGRDLTRHIASLRPGMKVLFTSGYTANVIAHHGVLDAGVHFMQKPFSMEDLAHKVREALDTVL